MGRDGAVIILSEDVGTTHSLFDVIQRDYDADIVNSEKYADVVVEKLVLAVRFLADVGFRHNDIKLENMVINAKDCHDYDCLLRKVHTFRLIDFDFALPAKEYRFAGGTPVANWAPERWTNGNSAGNDSWGVGIASLELLHVEIPKFPKPSKLPKITTNEGRKISDFFTKFIRDVRESRSSSYAYAVAKGVLILSGERELLLVPGFFDRIWDWCRSLF